MSASFIGERRAATALFVAAVVGERVASTRGRRRGYQRHKLATIPTSRQRPSPLRGIPAIRYRGFSDAPPPGCCDDSAMLRGGQPAKKPRSPLDRNEPRAARRQVTPGRSAQARRTVDRITAISARSAGSAASSCASRSSAWHRSTTSSVGAGSISGWSSTALRTVSLTPRACHRTIPLIREVAGTRSQYQGAPAVSSGARRCSRVRCATRFEVREPRPFCPSDSSAGQSRIGHAGGDEQRATPQLQAFREGAFSFRETWRLPPFPTASAPALPTGGSDGGAGRPRPLPHHNHLRGERDGQHDRDGGRRRCQVRADGRR